MRRALAFVALVSVFALVASCASSSPDPVAAAGPDGGVGGQAGACIPCKDALSYGKNGATTVCASGSAAWQDVIHCACVGTCAIPCQGACEGGAAEVGCKACLADAVKGCPAKLAACTSS